MNHGKIFSILFIIPLSFFFSCDYSDGESSIRETQSHTSSDPCTLGVGIQIKGKKSELLLAENLEDLSWLQIGVISQTITDINHKLPTSLPYELKLIEDCKNNFNVFDLSDSLVADIVAVEALNYETISTRLPISDYSYFAFLNLQKELESQKTLVHRLILNRLIGIINKEEKKELLGNDYRDPKDRRDSTTPILAAGEKAYEMSKNSKQKVSLLCWSLFSITPYSASEKLGSPLKNLEGKIKEELKQTLQSNAINSHGSFDLLPCLHAIKYSMTDLESVAKDSFFNYLIKERLALFQDSEVCNGTTWYFSRLSSLGKECKKGAIKIRENAWIQALLHDMPHQSLESSSYLPWHYYLPYSKKAQNQ